MVHPLLRDARAHLEAARTFYGSPYLRPSKRNLVDVVVSKGCIDKALDLANVLFRALSICSRARPDSQNHSHTVFIRALRDNLWYLLKSVELDKRVFEA